MPIKYPEVVKRRAKELAPICRSASNIIDALLKEFDNDEVPMNERTIRRWLKEQNLRYLKNIEEHFAQLTDIANLLLEDDVGKVLTVATEIDTPERIYQVVSENSGFAELTHSQLVGRIEGNIDYVCQHYSTWHMWDCFAVHLEDEYPESKDFYRYLNTQTSTLINALRKMAERKTFKGTCPVCEDYHNKTGGL